MSSRKTTGAIAAMTGSLIRVA